MPELRDADYAFAVARIRSNETKLLTRQDIEGLLAAGSGESCLARLADRGWGGGLRGEVSEAALLDAEYERTWALVREVAPDFGVFRFMTVRNDYHNLKAALKGRLANTDWRHMYLEPCEIPADTISKAVSEKAFSLLPEDMAQAAEEAYEALITWVDGQLCEMILDRAALEASMREAEKQGGLAKKLTELDVFAADVRIAVRGADMHKTADVMRRALAGCGVIDTERLAMCAAEGADAVREYIADADKDAAEALGGGLRGFEALIRQRREKLLEAVKYDTLGVSPLIAYVIRRENEIADARIVLAGLRNNAEPERIRAMLSML